MNKEQLEKLKIEKSIKNIKLRINIFVPIAIGCIYLYFAFTLYSKELEKRKEEKLHENYRYDYIKGEYVCRDNRSCE
ncbi:hypothetical protein GCM10023151_11200 [Kangiella marina]|uniref:Uncharacterized protein n=1 Tax=Kangiella marina TaxID=1079178 RepID=A0ABP8IJM5_9GAMM